ncbi:MAG: hypothetical protein IPM29_29130 [Planctomycetes bacterium]|nr:hypothetical protein [Planctomycetota bacterium]
MTLRNSMLSVTLAVLLAACGSESGDAPATPSGGAPAGSPPPAPVAATITTAITTPEVHDAICGHVLEEVGHCGNYVRIDGRYVELVWPELGKMDYCAAGAAGAKVEIAGAMQDGRFVATSYRRVE